MKYKISFLLILVSLGGVSQVHIQQGAGVHLQENAGLYVEGDLTAFENITGTGSVFIIGDSMRSINANGFAIPALNINNSKAVSLSGDINILDRLTLTNGNLELNRYMVKMGDAATIDNSNESAIVTNSSGVIRKEVSSNLDGYFVPLSNGKSYTPLIISSNGKYSNGYIDVSSFAVPSPHKPANAGEYLNNHWKVVSKNIDGEVNVVATTGNSTSISGDLAGYVWQDGKWKISPFDARKIRATIKSGEAEIYAMAISNNSLQPNPATHNTTFVYHSPAAGRSQLAVTDSRGRIVYVRTVMIDKGVNQFILPLENFVKGYYDVSLIQQGKKTSLKLVKQ